MRHVFMLLGIYAVGLALTLFGAYIDSDAPNPNKLSFGLEIFYVSVIVFGLLTSIFYALFFTFKGIKHLIEHR